MIIWGYLMMVRGFEFRSRDALFWSELSRQNQAVGFLVLLHSAKVLNPILVVHVPSMYKVSLSATSASRHQSSMMVAFYLPEEGLSAREHGPHSRIN